MHALAIAADRRLDLASSLAALTLDDREKAPYLPTAWTVTATSNNPLAYEEMSSTGAAPRSIRRGRFLSVDATIDFDNAIHSPQMWNRYAYVHNSPISLVDPNGRQAVPGQGYVIGQGWTTSSVLDPAHRPTPEMVRQFVEVTGWALSLVGVGEAIQGLRGAFALARAGFSAGERGVISTALSILKTGGKELVAAYESGEAKELTIAGQKIIVQPDAPISGMTLQGEKAFVLGKEAFSSRGALAKTILHEMYRLTFQGGTEASGASVAAATKAAAAFAEKAFDALIKLGFY